MSAARLVGELCIELFLFTNESSVPNVRKEQESVQFIHQLLYKKQSVTERRASWPVGGAGGGHRATTVHGWRSLQGSTPRFSW